MNRSTMLGESVPLAHIPHREDPISEAFPNHVFPVELVSHMESIGCTHVYQLDQLQNQHIAAMPFSPDLKHRAVLRINEILASQQPPALPPTDTVDPSDAFGSFPVFPPTHPDDEGLQQHHSSMLAEPTVPSDPSSTATTVPFPPHHHHHGGDDIRTSKALDGASSSVVSMPPMPELTDLSMPAQSHVERVEGLLASPMGGRLIHGRTDLNKQLTAYEHAVNAAAAVLARASPHLVQWSGEKLKLGALYQAAKDSVMTVYRPKEDVRALEKAGSGVGRRRISAKMVSAELLVLPVRLQRLEGSILECHNLLEEAKRQHSESGVAAQTLRLSMLHAETAEALKQERSLLETQERASRDRARNVSKRKRCQMDEGITLNDSPVVADGSPDGDHASQPIQQQQRSHPDRAKEKFGSAIALRRSRLWSHYTGLSHHEGDVILAVGDALRKPGLWLRENQYRGAARHMRVSPFPELSLEDFYFAASFISSCAEGPLTDTMAFSLKVTKYILDEFHKAGNRAFEARYFTIRELLCDGGGLSPRALPSSQKALDRLLHVPLIAALYQCPRESGPSWKLFVKGADMEVRIAEKVLGDPQQYSGIDEEASSNS